MEVLLHAFLSSALDCDEQQASRTDSFTSAEASIPRTSTDMQANRNFCLSLSPLSKSFELNHTQTCVCMGVCVCLGRRWYGCARAFEHLINNNVTGSNRIILTSISERSLEQIFLAINRVIN